MTTLYPVQVAFVVMGYKTDLQEEVGWSEGQTWARSRGTQLLMCSAQTGQGVEEAFREAARLAASIAILLSYHYFLAILSLHGYG